MLNDTHKNLIKKLVKIYNFSDIIDCMIETACDEGLANYKVGNENIAENYYEIEELLCATKTKIKVYENCLIDLMEQKTDYNKEIFQASEGQIEQLDGFKD